MTCGREPMAMEPPDRNVEQRDRTLQDAGATTPVLSQDRAFRDAIAIQSGGGPQKGA